MTLLSSLASVALLLVGFGVLRSESADPRFAALTLVDEAARARAEGRLDEAEKIYGRMITQRAHALEGRWGLATLLYDRGRFAEARRAAGRIVEARPTDSLALALRALCDSKLGAREGALVDLLRARKLGIPSGPLAQVVDLETAVLLNRLGDPDASLRTLRFFAINSDDRPAVIAAFGLATLRLPLTPEEIPPDKTEMVLLAGRGGYHRARGGASETGRMAIEELSSRYRSEPNVHYALGMFLLREEPEKALDAFRRELAVSPDHWPAMIQIALAELRRGRAEAALPMAEGAVRLTPQLPAAHVALGRALLGIGQSERGVMEMETAVKLAPDNPRVHYALAQAYAQVGRSEDAHRERGEFLRLEKDSEPDADGEADATPENAP